MTYQLGGTESGRARGVGKGNIEEVEHSTPTFTPGPWWLCRSNDERYDYKIRVGDRVIVTVLLAGEADANLIVAAPELFEAAEEAAELIVTLFSDLEYGHLDQVTNEERQKLDRLRAVIAKAEGRTDV